MFAVAGPVYLTTPPVGGLPSSRVELHASRLLANQRVKISSGQVVRRSARVDVITYVFSTPTPPRPGEKILGSTAITTLASSGASYFGAMTGISSSSRPTPCATNLT